MDQSKSKPMNDDEYHKLIEQATLLIERKYVVGISLQDLILALHNKTVLKLEMKL